MYSKAICTVDFRFEQENFEEDLKGNNGSDNKAFAKRLLAKHKKGPSQYADMVMDLENKARDKVAKDSGLRRLGSGDYDGQDILSVGYSVNSLADVQKLRDLFDRDGRDYDMAPYIEASGMMLWLEGYNGPVGGVDSAIRRDYDLDEWLEEQKAAEKKAAKKTAKRRARR
jgi:hypothetical protein